MNAYSQEMEPRIYGSVPVGVNVAALSYSYSNGNVVSSDPTSAIQGLDLNSNTVALAYVRTFGFLKKLCRIQIALPFVFLTGTAKLKGSDTSGARTGFADTKVRIGMNLFGSPAYSPKEFAKYQDKTVFGTSLVISIPTGQYYVERAINLGANRWGFKPEIGLSKRFGAFYGEIYSGVWLFTKNTEYLKTNTVTQNPLFTFQGHVSYLFPSKIWIAVSGTYVNGGDTKVNGIQKNDFQKNFRTGATLSVPLSLHSTIKAIFQTGVETRVGGNFTIYSLAYQYSWL